MNLSALTAKEVMRICHPETELEKRLFEIINEIDYQEHRDDVIRAIDSSENFEESYDAIKMTAKLAIEQINKAIEKLEGVL